jgi:predicted regulator of Ras-like GTPase activity (Roadblock/LC7/MglB family)
MNVGATSWSFTEDDHAVITRTLDVFLAESNARCALLVDRAGQLVATVGEQPRFDATTFATLTAADFSANDQLARLVGETEFSALVHRGEQESMYLADVARRVILVVLFDTRTTEGLVRLRAKQTVEELARVFTELFERSRQAQAIPGGSGLFAGLDDEIDRLFQ